MPPYPSGFRKRADECRKTSAAQRQCELVDLGMVKAVFFTAGPDADLDGDGSVNFVDLGVMKAYFFGPPVPLPAALALFPAALLTLGLRRQS